MAFFPVLVGGLFAAPAFAQQRAQQAPIELIVRLEEGATGALTQALRPGGVAPQLQGRAAPDSAVAALMQTVQQTRPVFPASRSAGAPGAQPSQPIPAFVLQVSDSSALERVRDRLADRSDVAYVQANHLYHVRGRFTSRLLGARASSHLRSTDPLLDSLRYFPVVHVPEAHEVTTGSSEVLVGVVDTGIFLEHPDLADQIWVNPGEDNGNGRIDASDFDGIDDDRNGFVDDLHGYDFVDRPDALNTGDYAERDPDPSHDRLEPASLLANPHGTNVAGIIAAAKGNDRGIAGVAPSTRLVPLRAFGGDGAGADDDVAAAIVYAADLGVDVLNFSFGDVYYSRLMEEAIRYASQRGVVMAASAGNNAAGTLQEEHYPSDYPEVISVAQLAVEVGLDNDLVLRIPGKYGTGLDLSAPGTNIFTTTLPRALTGANPDDPDPAAFYDRASGSSFAAPQVAATAALLRSLKPDLSAEAIRAIITASAEDLESEGWDQRTGAGLLDVGSAVRRALPARTAITEPGSDDGIRREEAAVIGTSLDPSFRSFSVYYAQGDTVGFSEDDLTFTRIAGPVEKQVLQDTLAIWNTGALAEGLYTLRLATRLQDGSTVEERRRIHIDRSPPDIRVRLLDKGMIGRHMGVLADVSTDDLTTVTMRVTGDGPAEPIASNRRARRHGLRWAAPDGDGGTVQVEIRARNVAGLSSSVEKTLQLPPSRLNTSLFSEERLEGMPAGLLLPRATDYDGDDLFEITLSAYGPRAARTDTLRTYEWDGSGFTEVQTLLTNLAPRDAGDTDSDDRGELLLQIGGASLLIEQPAPGGRPAASAYPDFSNVAFVDTTGLSGDSTALNGALLTDIDTDGRGEILGHDGPRWRLLEERSGTYAPIARLENPTADSTDEEYGPAHENRFGTGRAQAGDFDGDGRRGFVATDNGGDFILYEAQSDDRLEPVWTHRTARYAGAGRRVAAGDLDGDGAEEFVTYTRPFVGVTADAGRAPAFGLYYVWDATADNQYRLADRLAVQGVGFRNNDLADGAMAVTDFDGDGRAELAVVDAPALYVFRYDTEDGLVPLFHRGVPQPPTAGHPRSDGLDSPTVVTADFDRSGAPDLIVAAADGEMRRFVYQRAAGTAPPPRWVQAAPTGADTVRLEWRASGADSVTVYRGPPDGVLDRYATVRRGVALTDTSTVPVHYALRAHYGPDASPLSERRTVRPGGPPTVAEVTYPSAEIVRLRFTRRVDPGVRTEQFSFQETARGSEAGPVREPAGLTFAENERVLALRFEGVAGANGMLRWQGVKSTDGVPVVPTSASVAFPKDAAGTLVVKQWDLLDAHRVALLFSAPLAPSVASNVNNYAVTAPGEVAEVHYDPATPRRVVVRVAGLRVGPTGRENALTVAHMRSRTGIVLASEGHTVRLSEAAADLDEVYVYPNPYHAGRHGETLTVAGLPAEATVKVLSTAGTLVRTLEERGADGGLDWDLTDRRGERVPSGIYLIRVNAPEVDPVLKKAAVIR